MPARATAGIVLAAAVLVALMWLSRRAELPAGGPLEHPAPTPFLVFRTLADDELHGRVAILPLSAGGVRQASPISCVRVHYAGGRGLCVDRETIGPDVVHAAYVFDGRFERGPRLRLEGIATRVRVAPNGRVGAITTYAEEEGVGGERLSTRSVIVDMQTGQRVADVREFRIDHQQSPPITGSVDVASVAFESDGDRFFATLATEAERYLVAGSLRERRLTTIRPGVANEALSPDGTRLAVKRLVPERGFWQVAVIDLRSWAVQDLAHGSSSIDDQVEWLDDRHVLYHDVDGDTTALWTLPIDGVQGPRVLVRHAYSGAVQR